MSKRMWNQEGSLLIRAFKDGVEDLHIELSDLFKNWEKHTEVQQACISNGIKQKLTDLLAVSKDMKMSEAEKRERMKAKWEDIYINGNWNSQGFKKGPYVSLRILVPELAKAGMTSEHICTVTGGAPEEIAKILNQSN